MCWSCGCLRPEDDHGDSRNLTTLQLKSAAAASNIDVPTAVSNMVRTLALHRGRTAGTNARKELLDGVLATRLVKSVDERRYTLGVAYAANLPDIGKAVDGFRDFMSPEALELAAWRFLAKGAEVGILHKNGTEGHGVVVESYIYRGPDWEIETLDRRGRMVKAVVKAGDWLVGAIWDEMTWAAWKSGQLGSYSPQGRVKRRRPDEAALANLRSRE